MESQFNVGGSGEGDNRPGRGELVSYSGDEYSKESGSVGSDDVEDEDTEDRISADGNGVDEETGNGNGDGEPGLVEAGPMNGHGGVKEHPRTDKNRRKIYFSFGMKRSLFCCKADAKKVDKLIDLIETKDVGNGALVFGDPEEKRCWGVVVDSDGIRRRCEAYRK